MKKPIIHIIVEDGLVQNVYADTPVEVVLLDFDTDDPDGYEMALDTLRELRNDKEQYIVY